MGCYSRRISKGTLLLCFLECISGCNSLREQLTQIGKETGETAHVERWNNTLRQRNARFVRDTLSFSKTIVMHIACLILFLHRYNQQRAINFK
ncbi:MAG: hypothetical protein E6J34_14625 [Chloroflexi bacterium]|nr:MAG: hypothetical protein E6J34_14625 [Chloroflexota bacterium]